MKIRVTAEHIADGVRRNSHRCIIALALMDTFKDAQYVEVDGQFLKFSDPNKRARFTFRTPLIAQKNLQRWDDPSNPPVDPFVFALDKPIETKPMGSRDLNERRGRRARKRSTTPRNRVIVHKERVGGFRVFEERPA